MKILNIIQCTNLGGMEQSTLKTMSVLKQAGHDVAMISLHPVGPLRALADTKHIPIDGAPRYKLYGLGNIPWLLGKIKEFDPDRIWLTGHNFGSLIAAYFSKRPIYLSIHFHHCERSMLFWRIFYFLARRCCVGIRFITRYIFNEVAFLSNRHDNVVCFPNVFEEPEAPPDVAFARSKLSIPSGSFVIGNAGWLIQRKAFDVFIETAALVKQMIPESLFVIAGDGSERDRLEQMAKSLQIDKAVKFVGWQTDLEDFYCALDVLLFNSNFDAMGRTPIEALCHGVPVVASVTCGGLDEFIQHGDGGFLINRHDPKCLADEIKRLHDNPSLRVKIAQKGRARVLEMGSPDEHLKKISEFMKLK